MVQNIGNGGNQLNRDGVQKAAKNNWTVEDQLKLVSMLGSGVLAIASLIVSNQAQKSASRAEQTVDASRVETGWVTSNSNGRDFGHPWRKWESYPEKRTAYVGIQRNVVFTKPFKKIPRVSTAFSLIDTKPLDSVLPALGDKNIDKDTARRLHDIHVITDSGDVSENGFVVFVGIGLPTEPGEYLGHLFLTAPPDSQLVERMEMGQLDSAHGSLDLDEAWMVNFFKIIGTINVSWIAQAPEK